MNDIRQKNQKRLRNCELELSKEYSLPSTTVNETRQMDALLVYPMWQTAVWIPILKSFQQHRINHVKLVSTPFVSIDYFYQIRPSKFYLTETLYTILNQALHQQTSIILLGWKY
ncbi:hypothetical protein ACTA71_010541 [Dictyostelium dimigraforme]